MDYLFKLLGLGDLEKTRFDQINRQRTLDEQVEKKVHLCPNLISMYYLSQREISRQQQTQFIKSGLTEKVAILKRQFTDNDKYYNDLEESLRSTDFCRTMQYKHKHTFSQYPVAIEESKVVTQASKSVNNSSCIAHPH
jgi:predicted nuclease with TOPRIM domain